MTVILNNYLDNLNVNFSAKSESTIINFLKKLELAYWKYLDHYKPEDSPPLSFQEFVYKYINNKEIGWSKDQVKRYMNLFWKFQKTIPTAGAVIYDQSMSKVLLVKVYGSDLYGFPKGKMDENDQTIVETAIRETLEETGINIGDIISQNSPYVKINKTVLYQISGCPVKNFTGYNSYEITDLGWHSIHEIITNPDKYTKQVRTFVKGLKDHSDKVIMWN